jgi:NitT/TauT family transport system permease protein
MNDLTLEDAGSGRTSRGRVRVFDAAVLTLLILALWQAIGSWTQGVAVSPPLQTLAYLFDLLRTSMFWGHAAATLEAFLLAFALSALIGLALGLIFGVQRFTGEVAEPILAGFYTIPKVTLYPVVLLIFGLAMSAKVAFGVMHGLVPMTLFTLGAVRSLNPVYAKTARVIRGGTEQDIPIEQVRVGDILIVKPGEKIPVDGRHRKSPRQAQVCLAPAERLSTGCRRRGRIKRD